MRRTAAVVGVVFLALGLAGCPKDERIQRQSNLNAVKAEVARNEFTAAATDAEKVAIAAEYFRTAPEEIRVVDDYLWKRKPDSKSVKKVMKALSREERDALRSALAECDQ